MKKITFAIAVFTLFLTALYTNANAQCSLGNNRIVNGDAEGNPGATGNNVVVAGWSNETAGFTVAPYGTTAGSGIPGPYADGPPAAERGGYLFYGGTNSNDSAAEQLLIPSDCYSEIDLGDLRFDMSGYFGGYLDQTDNAVLTVTFRDSGNVVLRTISIGAVTDNERENKTGMLYQGRTGLVPSGTRNITIRLLLDRVEAGNNNGYADNLKFILNAPSTDCQLSANLLVNGDAEADQDLAGEGGDHEVTGWHVETGNFTAIKFFEHFEFLPPNPGNYYFSGGLNVGSDYARQYVDISPCASQIDSGILGFNMSGDFGGWEYQNDRANLNVTFLDNFDVPIGTATVGGVLAADRGRKTIFVHRATPGMIPVGTRTVKADLVMTRVEGNNNDGYADNLEFSLFETQ